ncbi:hypothetical protein SNEBB_006552 [Seison nebaliae]|nr:hypothetical protein SNEBB_006552 [Seison nebaliae]
MNEHKTYIRLNAWENTGRILLGVVLLFLMAVGCMSIAYGHTHIKLINSDGASAKKGADEKLKKSTYMKKYLKDITKDESGWTVLLNKRRPQVIIVFGVLLFVTSCFGIVAISILNYWLLVTMEGLLITSSMTYSFLFPLLYTDMAIDQKKVWTTVHDVTIICGVISTLALILGSLFFIRATTRKNAPKKKSTIF